MSILVLNMLSDRYSTQFFLRYNTVMKILDVAKTSLDQLLDDVVETLKRGGLVIFPTETTYGAGVDATNPDAVAKLLAFKTRREGKPLSIAVSDIEMAQKYVELNDQARRLYQQFLPGPVTVISEGKHVVAPGVESEFGTLGVRIPDYELVLKIVTQLGRPMTATSANQSGGKNPYSIDNVLAGLSQKQLGLVDLVLDAGRLAQNPPSTVIDTTLSTPVTVRAGAVGVSGSTAGNHPDTGKNRISPVSLISRSESETKSIAGKLLFQHWSQVQDRGLVVALDGSLGVGKTIFAKGVAEFLGISETLTSPTYSYIQEYDYRRHNVVGKLFHLDLWKVDNQDHFERLEIDKLVTAQNVLVVEWFGQVERFFASSGIFGGKPTLLRVMIKEIEGGSSRVLEIGD
jgi:L-threonylcarbamoyladenylate synthase